MRFTAVMFPPTAQDLSPLPEVCSKDFFETEAHRVLADGHVRIWSTEAIYNAANPNFSKPRQLAHMSYHSGTIHTVRFSPSGRFLASGADDKIVCVYTLDPTPPSHTATFGTLSFFGRVER